MQIMSESCYNAYTAGKSERLHIIIRALKFITLVLVFIFVSHFYKREAFLFENDNHKDFAQDIKV